jgi:RHS repeat-associated protein
MRRADTEQLSVTPEWQYVWPLRYIDAPVLRERNTDTDGACDDERLYYLNDANFNVTTLVDTNGDAVERYLYDAYGRVTVYDEAWSNTRSESSYANVVLYTGRERDAETGLYHYRHRSYEAELGRFASRDPLGYKACMNLTEYTFDSPTNRTDAKGLQAGPMGPFDPRYPGTEWPSPAPPRPAPTPPPVHTPAPYDVVDECGCRLCANVQGAIVLWDLSLAGIPGGDDQYGGNPFRHCWRSVTRQRSVALNARSSFGTAVRRNQLPPISKTWQIIKWAMHVHTPQIAGSLVSQNGTPVV